MQRIHKLSRALFFFFLGAGLTSIVVIASVYLIFTVVYREKIYPGVTVAGVDVSGQGLQSLGDIGDRKLIFTNDIASVSATALELNLSLDRNLMTKRAYSVGRQTRNPYYNFLQIVAAWQGRIDLPLEISLDRAALDRVLSSVAPKIERSPVDALYAFTPNAGPDNRGRVTAFRPSENGLSLDRERIAAELETLAKRRQPETIWRLPLLTKVVLPNIQTSTADDLGIRTLLGRGESYFFDSIPGRVYNIGLGTEKISGSLVGPNEIFSFDQAIGTVSAVFGFQKAFSIVKGKTVLDDGGGVCQVSTTLYRAVLAAGLPVIERHAHSYRVGFYEQGGFLPGMDATVYPPDPDFRFKNDTGGWILIQTNMDKENHKLTFDLFGTSDGRKTVLTKPAFLSSTPPPDPVYEDDPTKKVGDVVQVDTAHYGAKVFFKRLVTRGTETLIDETVYSDFVPWPARYLKGTKT